MTRPAFEYVDRAVDLSPWIRDSPSWGKWYLRRGDDGAATISRVGLVIDVGDVTVSKRERVATAIYAAVDDWCALVIDWLEAGLGQALRLPSSQGGIGNSIRPWLWTHDGIERTLLYNDQQVGLLSSGGARAADSAALRRIFELAAELERPPLAWVLTRDASHHAFRSENRRAVLDAGTAAELALAKALVDYKIEHPKRATLGTLVKLAQEHHVPCPPRTQNDLVDVRNDAAHRGVEPSPHETAQALTTSATLVELAYPAALLLT